MTIRVLLIYFVLFSFVPSNLPAEPKKPSALAVLAFHGELRGLKKLLDEGRDPNLRVGIYDKSLFAGRDGGNSPLGSESWTPLMAVAASPIAPDTQFMIADALLEKGALINERDSYGATALHVAINSRNIEFALYLLEKKCDPNSTVGVYIDNAGGESPLHDAIGHPILVKRLLEYGANATAKDNQGQTALDRARELGYLKSVELLEKGKR